MVYFEFDCLETLERKFFRKKTHLQDAIPWLPCHVLVFQQCHWPQTSIQTSGQEQLPAEAQMYVKPKHLGMVRQHVRFFFCLCPLAEISLHFLFQRHSRKKKGNIETYRISHLRQNSQNKVSPLEYYPWPVPVATKIFCIFYHLLFPGQMGTQTAIQKKKRER